MISPSVRRYLLRRRRRYVRFMVPVVSPYADRLRDAAVGADECRPLAFTVERDPSGELHVRLVDDARDAAS